MRFKTDLKEKALEGRTMTYIAKQIKMTKHYLTNIMNGKKDVPYHTAFAISRALKNDAVPEDYFKEV